MSVTFNHGHDWLIKMQTFSGLAFAKYKPLPLRFKFDKSNIKNVTLRH